MTRGLDIILITHIIIRLIIMEAIMATIITTGAIMMPIPAMAGVKGRVPSQPADLQTFPVAMPTPEEILPVCQGQHPHREAAAMQEPQLHQKA